MGTFEKAKAACVVEIVLLLQLIFCCIGLVYYPWVFGQMKERFLRKVGLFGLGFGLVVLVKTALTVILYFGVYRRTVGKLKIWMYINCVLTVIQLLIFLGIDAFLLVMVDFDDIPGFLPILWVYAVFLTYRVWTIIVVRKFVSGLVKGEPNGLALQSVTVDSP